MSADLAKDAAADEDRSGGIELFVPGRICLFGEHSDWAGSYRRFNSDISEGCALVCGTLQGLYATARKIKRRVLIFRDCNGRKCEFSLDDVINLRDTARSSSYFAYIAGTVLELGKHFRVGGADIDNHRTDLPIQKGLSSSAAVCVLIVRALNKLYDLKLTVHGEMDIAYRGEINTPSRCGRLDQCVAFGRAVTRMNFDGDLISAEPVRVAATLYLVVVDLCAKKDTKEILRSLSEAYPFPRNDMDKQLHELLGPTNIGVCEEAIAVMSKEKDVTKAAESIGALMTSSQGRWDKHATPFCPQELTAPVLHRLLECPALVPFITGGKGVGSQGDGSAQLVCRSEEAQDEVMKIVQGLGMEPLRLTIPASKAVRTAVLPIAGFCSGMWPATKCIGPWLFPVCRDEAVKPAICWICEELLSAGIEQIILVVNEVTEAQMRDLFTRREDAASLNKVASSIAEYDETLLSIGRHLTFVRQDRATGISDAVLLCERAIGQEPFLLAWGDHLASSTAADGKPCAAQLLDAFSSRSVASMQCIDGERVHTAGVFCCRKPPSPLPPPLGPRSSPEGSPVLWSLSGLAEKPSWEYAEEHLKTPCLEEGKFLASFGQYVLSPSIFAILRSQSGRHFTESLDTLRLQDGLDGVLVEGSRSDLGNMSTYLEALQAQLQKGRTAKPEK